MALRARLRETDDSFAAVAYDALLKPWSVISGHTDGDASDYQIRWLMKPERKNFLGKSLLDPSVLVVCVAPNRPSP